MSASPRLPLLAPPRPSFPAQFHTSDSIAEASSSTATWPEDAEVGQTEPAASSGEVTWQIKTDRELHLDRLEARLQQLRADPPPDLPPEDDAFLLPDSDFDEDGEGVVTANEGDEVIKPPEDEEGRALLSDAASPGTHGLVVKEEAAVAHEPVDLPESAEPPSRPGARPASSRISFKDSVRITSGFRSSSHQHQHQHARPANALPPVTERSGLLTGQIRTESAPSDLLVQAVAPSGTGTSSRSASPRARGGSRRASHSSTSLGSAATNLLHAGSSYQYSSSPASYGASRSSSPCSSIYAPLQPPSRHCPNPMLVRPVGGPLRRKRSSSSFQEFLRRNRHLSDEDDGGDGLGDESDEDSDDKADPDDQGDEAADDGEPVRLEYHDLVEQQRAKKARWEARRRVRAAQKRQAALRDAPTLWTKIARILLHGHSNLELLAVPAPDEGRQARAASRTAHDRRARPAHEHSPVRSSPLARAASHSSLSTVSSMADSDSDLDGDAGAGAATHAARSRSGFLRGTGASVANVKTEDDVRFGTAPARYFTVGWIKCQFRRLKRAVAKLFETALVGWRASRRRKRERECPVGYGAV
ncbi:hypothetical protein JCM3774_003437 [Rhodotorula dairenensis]